MRRLLYVVDPMCSWCYGFAPVLAELEQELAPGVSVELIMGGLAPDSDAPMDEDTRRYVQGAWREVTARTGVAFNHDFWSRCQPRRSTYPSCRAVLVAGARGRRREMLAAIHRAYYQEARNPSDAATLAALAAELGLDPAGFRAELDAPATQARLEADFARRRLLGVRSFPSIGVTQDGEDRLLASGWLDAAGLRSALQGAGLLA